MKQEDKDLLLKDLCARIPYYIKCHIEGENGVALPIGGYIEIDDIYAFNFIIGEHKRLDFKTLEEFKPYLFPLSSMTKEQKDEIKKFFKSIEGQLVGLMGRNVYFIDFCNKNHLDYRGLIPMGLAIDCTNLKVY